MKYEKCIKKIFDYDLYENSENLPPGTRFVHIIVNFLIDLGEIEFDEVNETFRCTDENLERIETITGYKIDDIHIYLKILQKHYNNKDYSELLTYLDSKYDSVYTKLFTKATKFKNQQTKPYSEKLKDPRWQKKRLKIFERDNWTCQLCETIDKTLHVHHFYYVKNKNPWEYEDEALVTLCIDCHDKEHESPIIEDISE